jgi:hypothetical protein
METLIYNIKYYWNKVWFKYGKMPEDAPYGYSHNPSKRFRWQRLYDLIMALALIAFMIYVINTI